MKSLAKIENDLDIVNKQYVDNSIGDASEKLNARINSIITNNGVSKIDDLDQTNYVIFESGSASTII